MPALSRLPPCPAEGLVHVVIESPRGSSSKLKYDPELEAFVLSRPLPLGIVYPHDWGFVPGTRASDGDPVDALVLSEGTNFPGVVIRARPIALLNVEQNAIRGGRERNDRIIAVPEKAPRSPLTQPDDLPERVRQELEAFFRAVTEFENKQITLLGWDGPAAALALVKTSRV